jgi:hypothetical protein
LNNVNSISPQEKTVVTLIATKPRLDSLANVALPSIAGQNMATSVVYIVADSRAFTILERDNLSDQFPSLNLQFLQNGNCPGAAGTWNTGLLEIEKRESNCYIAILDDDDIWDPEHLETCYFTAARNEWPDVVISGLRMLKNEIEITRPVIEKVFVDDFLVGNPGWQGSNTFVHINAFRRAGYFTDGLQSSNDRDLAIRLLSLPDIRVAFTKQFTSSWRLDAEPDCLSRRRGPEKIAGLQQFIQLHGSKMSQSQFRQFADRCLALFGVTEEELLA